HAQQLAAQMVLQAGASGVAVLRLEVVAVVARAAGPGRFADAVEVVALGAVLPVLALGGAEFVAVGAALGLGAFGGGIGAGRLGLALAGALGRAQALGQRLGRRRVVFVRFEKGVLVEHLLDLLLQLER